MKSALGLGKDHHKTLVDRFAYPVGGTGMVYRRLGEGVLRRGGKIHLGLPVLRVLHENQRVTGLHLADGKQPRFDHVVSTMPLTLLVRGLDGLPDHVAASARQLTYRNTIIVYLHVDGTDLFSDQWLYVHSPDLLAGRVTNFRNWVPELYGDARTSIVAAEYWCNDADALWSEPDEPLIDRAKRELQATGLLGNAPVLDGHVMRIHRSYPVYQQGYRQHLARVMQFVDQFNGLTVIGRYGAFKYNNQDHSVLMGILAAENILHDARVDLTAVNTDYETYQESSLITETGLAEGEEALARA
jgi:protoporphyrinogen oxidase